jgi:hypothetical protein
MSGEASCQQSGGDGGSVAIPPIPIHRSRSIHHDPPIRARPIAIHPRSLARSLAAHLFHPRIGLARLPVFLAGGFTRWRGAGAARDPSGRDGLQS